MANFELDPEFFLPPGHNIIDGGPDRLPRTYTTPAVPIIRRHERFVIADVHPAPPAEDVIQVRQEVVALLLHQGLHVRSAQPWIEGVGLFELRDAAESYAAVHKVPQQVAHNSVVHFLRHDQGLGFRDQEGFREGCLMILGVPLDFRNTEDLRAAVNTFGEFHHWVNDDPYLVRSIVFAAFPDDRLVPRSINFSEYAAWGGAKVSWSAPVYILGAAAAEMLPNDEDPMPLNGNPHPLPGHLIHDNLQFALPPYHALGWNAVPLAPGNPGPAAGAADDGGWGQPPAAVDGGGWEPEAAPEARAADPVQDQESMVIDQLSPSSSDSVHELVDLDPLPRGDMEVEPAAQEPPLANPDAPDADMPMAAPDNDAEPEEDVPVIEEVHDDNPLAIVLYNPPPIQTDNIFVGAARVVYGPPLPPVMSWARSFDALMGAATAMHVPRQLQMPILETIMIPKRSWAVAFDTDAPETSLSEPASTSLPLQEKTEDVQVPPATPIPVIQEVGQSLGIAPEKLTVDRLMEDLADSAPSSSDV
ncbi:hypothetical protein D1007_58877 [Hordeum vulgare]|nr:hypothetical protein D1007_58877 [Hordeum vulgare]